MKPINNYNQKLPHAINVTATDDKNIQISNSKKTSF